MTAADPRSALVLFSGGQDSTACLAWALERFARVETIGFDYGQRHRIELQARLAVRSELSRLFPAWAARLGADRVLALHRLGVDPFDPAAYRAQVNPTDADIDAFYKTNEALFRALELATIEYVVLDLALLGQISDTALTDVRAIELNAQGLPNTFVPGRNLMFCTFAAAVAYRRGASVLVGGMCETDYSGYPDCRDNTLKALQVAISLGLAAPMTIETPLMWRTKAQTWELTVQLGGATLTGLIVEHTHTCYLGDRSQRHAWGYGCGACPACQLRRAGFDEWTGRLA